MRRTNLIITLSVVLFISFSFKSDFGIKYVDGNWKQALRQAKDDGKPVFLFVNAKGVCIRGQHMEEEMNADGLAAFFNQHFTCGRMNPANLEDNYCLTNWGIHSVPTLIFMDKNHKIARKCYGYKSKQEVLKEAETAMKIIKLRERQEKK